MSPVGTYAYAGVSDRSLVLSGSKERAKMLSDHGQTFNVKMKILHKQVILKKLTDLLTVMSLARHVAPQPVSLTH